MTTDLFNNATYYDSDDGAETLSHETPDDAIEEAVNNRWDSQRSQDENFEDIAPLTVHAWNRDSIDDKTLEGYASDAAVSFFETFSDNHGGPDGEELDAVKDEIIAGFAEVLKRLVKPEHVWQCTRVASREYSADEIKKVMEL